MIVTKEKPCKGIGKAFGFIGCGNKTIFRTHGLCSKCYPKFLLNDERGKIIMYKTINTVQKPRKDFEQYQREEKEKTALKRALKNTKTQVHAYIRNRDKGKNCISCGTAWNDRFEAGHHYSANSFLTLKFNLNNINGQCFYCNNKLEGNFDRYALNLPDRIGQDNYNELVRLAGIDKQAVKVWNLENLKEVRNNIKKLK